MRRVKPVNVIVNIIYKKAFADRTIPILERHRVVFEFDWLETWLFLVKHALSICENRVIAPVSVEVELGLAAVYHFKLN